MFEGVFVAFWRPGRSTAVYPTYALTLYGDIAAAFSCTFGFGLTFRQRAYVTRGVIVF